MRRTIVLCFLPLAIAITGAASGAQTWSISARQPCVGVTAGFAKPLAELNKLVGPDRQAAPGLVKGSGLVLLFVTACPNSDIAGKPTGTLSSAFLLVPVQQGSRAKGQTHAIAVLHAAGRADGAVMRLFRSHGITVSDAHVSLDVSNANNRPHAKTIVHFADGTLTLDAEMEPDSAPYKSTDTVAVRAQPAGLLFQGPESSTRYSHGKAQAHATAGTWMQDYELGQPLFVTLDTNFTWNFAFTETPQP